MIRTANCYEIIKRAGAKRGSQAGAIALRDALDKIGIHIAEDAIELAQYSGRKTVKAIDIETAAKRVYRSILSAKEYEEWETSG